MSAAAKELPPYAQLLQCRLQERDGETILTIPFHDDVVGRPGYLHGGAIEGLLEIAAFTALAREIGDPAATMKPITVTVDYMRPAGHYETHASAVVLRHGTSIANVGAFAWQQVREEPVAGARLNFLLERPAKA
ncbi:MAG: PaaI family thioesterase [Sphingomonas sp.]|nr:PaaI family thioesterase [Sphingomonas sp.]